MALDPTSNEWEVAMVDKATNYILQQHAGAVVKTDREPMPDDTEQVTANAMGCLLFEARHMELGIPFTFVFRFGRTTLAALRAIVDEMDDDVQR